MRTFIPGVRAICSMVARPWQQQVDGSCASGEQGIAVSAHQASRYWRAWRASMAWLAEGMGTPRSAAGGTMPVELAAEIPCAAEDSRLPGMEIRRRASWVKLTLMGCQLAPTPDLGGAERRHDADRELPWSGATAWGCR